MKKPKLPSLKSLKIKLDKVFSEYIRARDKGKPCVTCGSRKWPLQCGHWIKRGHTAVRWDERNAAGQCARCNLYLNGAQDEFAAVIVKRHGDFGLNDLLRLKHTTVKMSREDFEERIKHFTDKLAKDE